MPEIAIPCFNEWSRHTYTPLHPDFQVPHPHHAASSHSIRKSSSSIISLYFPIFFHMFPIFCHIFPNSFMFSPHFLHIFPTYFSLSSASFSWGNPPPELHPGVASSCSRSTSKASNSIARSSATSCSFHTRLPLRTSGSHPQAI